MRRTFLFFFKKHSPRRRVHICMHENRERSRCCSRATNIYAASEKEEGKKKNADEEGVRGAGAAGKKQQEKSVCMPGCHPLPWRVRGRCKKQRRRGDERVAVGGVACVQLQGDTAVPLVHTHMMSCVRLIHVQCR